jgi:hypothetical protein
MNAVNLRDQLTGEEYQSIKESFFHIYHSFLNEGSISKEFVGCLFKWGVQLNIGVDELKYVDPEYDASEIKHRNLALVHLYNLVYMIYLDGMIEDIELQVVTRYAEKLGFRSHIVNDLLKTIVTAPDDGYDFRQVKEQIVELLGSNN